MSDIKTILVPTDFSKPSDKALAMATSIARKMEAKVHLLHAYQLPLEVVAPIPAPYQDQLHEMSVQGLEELQDGLSKHGITSSAEAVDESPLVAISAAAKRHSVDLIVMGSRGAKGLEHVFLGSVAERTVRTAHCPVLTVRRDCGPEETFATIVVAMDFSDPASRALALARQFASKMGPARLILVHAHYIPPDVEALFKEQGTPLPRPSLAPVAERLEPMVLELQDAGLTSDFVLEPGVPERLIVDVAKTNNADLIAIGTHGRGGLSRFLLGSVAERVVREAECPVLTTGPPEK
ncbi:MAG: universal stress protein [bacterium]|nr:universal stress protein [bacterium]